jgi:hypothetical protein
MKQLSVMQKWFTSITILLSAGFFYFLHDAIASDNASAILKYAIIYGVAMLANGFIFGYNDSQLRNRYDIGFRYNLLTYITVNMTYLFYSLFSGKFSLPFLSNLFITAFCWGIGVMVHYYFARKAIKGMDADEVFL